MALNQRDRAFTSAAVVLLGINSDRDRQNVEGTLLDCSRNTARQNGLVLLFCSTRKEAPAKSVLTGNVHRR
eukprot:6502756-Pyramimonas_sp.AAC.1